MNTLLAALMLVLTIAAALGLGIILGYVLITAILHAMRPRTEAPKPAPTLAASQAHGGD